MTRKSLHPAIALGIIVGGWIIGLILRTSTFPRPGGFAPSFVPNSHDTSIALLDVGVTFCIYGAAGWLLAPPHADGGRAAWIVLPIVLLMLGSEIAIKAMSMALSLNYDYWVYVTRSLPLDLSGSYLLMPIVGLVIGLIVGSVIRLWRLS